MTPTTRSYLRKQVIISGVSNAILNSLFFYLSNAEMGVITYEKVFSDTLITCGFVACLVTWPTYFFTRKEVRAGLPTLTRNRLIDFLPKRWPLLWLTLWLFSALVVEILTFLGFLLFGINEIALLPMLIIKFLSMGLLGGSLAALVAARYLQPGAVGVAKAK